MAAARAKAGKGIDAEVSNMTTMRPGAPTLRVNQTGAPEFDARVRVRPWESVRTVTVTARRRTSPTCSGPSPRVGLRLRTSTNAPAT